LSSAIAAVRSRYYLALEVRFSNLTLFPFHFTLCYTRSITTAVP